MSKTAKDKLKRYSTCIREWARSAEAYALLDKYLPYVSDWGAGGCAPLATALHRIMPGSSLWVVESREMPGLAQHIVVKWQGLFWDGRGGRQKRSVERYWANELGWPPVKARIVPITDAHRAEMADWGTCPAALISEIVQALAPCA